MASIFELWVECKDKESAEHLAQHFMGLKHTLLSGRTIKWNVQITLPPLDNLGVIVSSEDLRRHDFIRSLQDTLESTEAGIRFYHHLQSAPDFRFAYVGWDATSISMEGLLERVDTWPNGEHNLDLACVVDDELYKKLGFPVFFQQFRDGYWWRAYDGESYRPILGQD